MKGSLAFWLWADIRKMIGTVGEVQYTFRWFLSIQLTDSMTQSTQNYPENPK